jgi:hypothetical protein
MTFKEAQELYKYIKDIPGGFDAVYKLIWHIEVNCPPDSNNCPVDSDLAEITCVKCWQASFEHALEGGDK